MGATTTGVVRTSGEGRSGRASASGTSPNPDQPRPSQVKRNPTLTALSIAFAFSSFYGCGSNDSASAGPRPRTDAGSGTHPICTPGDTRKCVGVGACDGGQACDASGNWGACQCASASAGGAAGAAGAQNTGGSNGNGGTASASGGVVGSGGQPADGGVDPNGNDPCPADPPTINCSSQCGGPDADCAQIYCSGAPRALPGPAAGKPIVIRTPDHPGALFACACSPGLFGIRISEGAGPGDYNDLTVGAPWTLSRAGAGECLDPTPKSCLYGFGGNNDYLVATTDPNAPARNVVIRFYGDFGTPCLPP